MHEIDNFDLQMNNNNNCHELNLMKSQMIRIVFDLKTAVLSPQAARFIHLYFVHKFKLLSLFIYNIYDT